MFSLQTIFGKGNQFFGLLEDAAGAAADSTVALHAMLRGSDKTPALDAFRHARERERGISDKINEELVNSFVTAIEREDIEALSSALVRIPKQVERFATAMPWPPSCWTGSTSPRGRPCWNRLLRSWWTWSANCAA